MEPIACYGCCYDEADRLPSMFQLISVVMDLTEVLKTSFSERSLHARSLGEIDYTADAGVTAITMMEVRFPFCRLLGCRTNVIGLSSPMLHYARESFCYIFFYEKLEKYYFAIIFTSHHHLCLHFSSGRLANLRPFVLEQTNLCPFVLELTNLCPLSWN